MQELINSFRVRGHLMADIDPLEYVQRTHPDLEIEEHGLTFWDLDREFVTNGFGGKRQMKLRDILGVLRDSYCRTIGIEYMHIQDPEQRRWFQENVEVKYTKPGHDEQLRILDKLNQAEAFETFLQTKYVGQKRFSLEGGESLIPLLDEILQGAAEAGLDGAAIGMAHRGRLNVLTNIAGKTYGQVFREFEGSVAIGIQERLGRREVPPRHRGHVRRRPRRGAPGLPRREPVAPRDRRRRARGHRPRQAGPQAHRHLLVAADPRARRRRLRGPGRRGRDAADVAAARLPHRRHDPRRRQQPGRLHDDAAATAARSVYATDVAKTIQAPILHVNGDDPEAVIRVAQVAFAYRERFHRDVVIDLVCYRRRGHNEGDDPSMTQPLMTNLIEAKRSVRRLYTESLVGRGDITEEEYEQAKRDFQNRLEIAFAETHAAETGASAVVQRG